MNTVAASRQIDAAQLLENARSLIPQLKKRSFDAEKQRRIPQETMDELLSSGLLRAVQPAAFGGHDIPVGVFRQITFEFAQVCGSTAWVYSVLGGFSRVIASMLPLEAQRDIWGDNPDALSCNVLMPRGVGTAQDGGYLVSGKYSYASGCDFAQWAVIGAQIEGKPLPPGAACWGMLVPMSSAEVIDDWHVLGLAATGSRSLVFKDVFVPAHRIGPVFPPMGSGGPYAFSTVAAGIGRGAIRRFVEYLVERKTIMRGWSAESDGLQIKVSESAAEVDAAWAMICRDCAEVEDTTWGSDIPPAVRARNRRNAAFAAQLAVRAVERLYLTAGGSAAYTNSPIQQSLRDVHTASMHMSMHWDVAAMESGKVLLGMNGETVF